MHLRSTRRLVSVLLIAILLTTGLLPTAFASVSAKVNSSSAKVYKSASTSSASLNVPKNLALSVTAISGSWAKVSYKGNSAYMPIKYLTPTSKTKRYTTNSTAVYNNSGKKSCTVSAGTSVYVLGTIGDYYCVSNGSGAVGYVKTGTLSDKKPTVSNIRTGQGGLSKVEKALALAQTLLGSKYARSDNPPTTFNCSSFVQYCMGKAGISMKGTAATQAADGRYSKVSKSDLKRGDILFFDTTENGKVDHSAMYLGNNKFIEASQHAGKVQINTLNSWYKKHLVGARRPA